MPDTPAESLERAKLAHTELLAATESVLEYLCALAVQAHAAGMDSVTQRECVDIAKQTAKRLRTELDSALSMAKSSRREAAASVYDAAVKQLSGKPG